MLPSRILTLGRAREGRRNSREELFGIGAS
jgi:hypothetical protein